MPMSPEALKAWAKGAKAENMDQDEIAEESAPEMGQEGEAERNLLWAGELEQDPSPEEAAELLDWLQDNEPEIYDALMLLADPMVDHIAAESALMEAQQYLAPEYPALDEPQREMIADMLSSMAPDFEQESDEWKVALASAIAKARAGEDVSEGSEEQELEMGEEADGTVMED